MRKYLLPILVLVLANIAIFYKFFFQDLLPFPGDLLVSYYFPWNGGGFIGFDPWTTRKDVIAMDVIRQMYPWKTLAFEMINKGSWPLWNPHNFSGTPLLANLQSAILFPTNLFYLFLNPLPGWITQVIVTPLLFSIFCFLFLKSSKLSNIAAVFGAIALTNISYITVWAEQLVVIQSALFLPLILLLVNRSKLILIPPLLALSLFGGHIQTTVYVYIIAFAYMCFKNVSLVKIALVFLGGILFSAPQLLPSLELYLHSARDTAASTVLFLESSLPLKNLITVVAPDYFGNPAVGNFSGRDYGNFQAYFGVIAFFLSLLTLSLWKVNRNIKFFLILGTLGLIFSIAPASHIFNILKIPVLSSGYPSRMIFIFQFCFAVLAAFGLDVLLRSRISKKTIILTFLALIFTFLASYLFGSSVGKRNLVLPAVLFLATALMAVFGKFRLVGLILIVLVILEYSYFFNKYQPFAPEKFVFPNHPVFSFLKDNSEKGERFYGSNFSYIDNNFATFYRVYSPEGYDPLYIKRYGEFLTRDGDIQRSDAVIPQKNFQEQTRALDILGVKYFVQITDDKQNKWKFENRINALDRVKLFFNYQKKTSPNEILDSLYSPNFPISDTLILEQDPPLKPQPGSGTAEIVSYTPNKVVVKTNSTADSLLFLSDSFYPGWEAFVDSKKEDILRANYTLRAVSVPKGTHTIVFVYNPINFQIGLFILILTTLGWGILVWRKFYAKK